MDNKYFLIYDWNSMPRWCQMEQNSDLWIDFKGRHIPFETSEVLAHTEGSHVGGAMSNIKEAVVELEKEFAYYYLLDPWSHQGWLDPRGKFWGCQFYQHDDIAYALLRKHPKTLEREGWIRVHADTFMAGDRLRGIPKRQRDTLSALGFTDFDMFRHRDPRFNIDRDAPPPRYAEKAPATIFLNAYIASLQKEPTVEECLPELEVKLIEKYNLSSLFDQHKEVIPDVGPGSWMWMIQWDDVHIGSPEHPGDLCTSKGLHLYKTSFDTIEISSWADHEFIIDDDAARLLASSITPRYASAPAV